MDILAPELPVDSPDRLAVELERTVSRLRVMSLVRLAAPLSDGVSRAGRALLLAQQLADAEAGVVGGPQRPLPEVGDSVAGDVLAVCGNDLVAAVRAAPRSGAAACAQAVTALIELRRIL